LGFAIEQIMVLNDDYKINNKCLIKVNNTNNIPASNITTEIVTNSNNIHTETTHNEGVVTDTIVDEALQSNSKTTNNPISLTLKDLAISNDNNEDINNVETTAVETNTVETNDEETNTVETNDEETNTVETNSEETNDVELNKKEQPLEDNLVLHEAEIKIPENNETSVSLKKPNEVYLEIYSEVKRRAKEAKLRALAAELEVKRVKALYMLDDIDSSSDEDYSDNSESEDAELSN
jgi:hypothetical protein